MKKLIDKIYENEKTSLRNIAISLGIVSLSYMFDYNVLDDSIRLLGCFSMGWYGKPIISNVVDALNTNYFQNMENSFYEYLNRQA